MRTGLIYKVTSPSNKVYIGQTIVSLQKRKRKHFADAKDINSRAYHTPFSRAIRKYGDQLRWEVLLYDIPGDQLNNTEREFIAQYKSNESGYNCNIGGGSGYGYRHTLEAKQKISHRVKESWKQTSRRELGHSLKGIPKTNEHKKKLSVANIGKKQPVETRQKKSLAMKGERNPMFGKPSPNTGKKLSQETKQKMSIAAKLREERKRKSSHLPSGYWGI